ncbi:glycosyltransferase [Serratia fonticola]|uniref:glycosyltransferase n=1 Tax=Serratia fonticola TaxID=47917 RepID=UPI003AAF0C7A
MADEYIVLIPAYNVSLVDVKKTFQSLDYQSNILVIDDGSDIPFVELIGDNFNHFINLDVKRLEENKGIEFALNYGLSMIVTKYNYIARLDIGDYSSPERFSLQVEYLRENSEVVLVGTWARFIDSTGEELFISKVPTNDSDIRKRMYINNMFIHPSVMMRASALVNISGYSTEYIACEDYELFFRLMNKGRVANLPKVLLDYEVNYSSISSSKRNKQLTNRLRLIIKNFKFIEYGVYPYYGVVRNLLMFFVNRNMTTKIRSILKK